MTPSGLHEGELERCSSESPTCAGLFSAEPGERSFESAARCGTASGGTTSSRCSPGKVRTGVGKDGTLTAAALHAFLADAVPRTLRRTHETAEEQTPLLLGEANAGHGRRRSSASCSAPAANCSTRRA